MSVIEQVSLAKLCGFTVKQVPHSALVFSPRSVSKRTVHYPSLILGAHFVVKWLVNTFVNTKRLQEKSKQTEICDTFELGIFDLKRISMASAVVMPLR